MNEFLELVQKMRAAQKRYFKEKTQAALVESRILERKVDLALEKRKTDDRQEEEVPW